MGIIYGARVATIQAFLSDTVLGGATMFVEQSNATVIPKKQLLWYNFKPNGETEPNLLPSTCPLLVGENIVIEKGIWRLGLDSKAKCGLKKKSSNFEVVSVETYIVLRVTIAGEISSVLYDC
ncbi:Prolyl 4-hydroxylase subunit alpha-1 [Bulinus truncatus]|nr:Prolyl 4-hydroxylase subunit alpha-1 [Bulinus truncatus]